MYTLKHFDSFRCCCFSAASLLPSALAGYSLTAHTFHNLNSFFQRFIVTWPLVVAVSFCYFCSSCFFFSQHMHPTDSPHTNTYNLIYFHWYYYTLLFYFFRKWGLGQRNAIFLFQLIFSSTRTPFFTLPVALTLGEHFHIYDIIYRPYFRFAFRLHKCIFFFQLFMCPCL